MVTRPVSRTHLREARKLAGLTLEEAEAALARHGIDLSAGQLSRIERGVSSVTQGRLTELGRLYGWSPAELLAGREAGKRGHSGTPARMLKLINRVQAGHWTEVANPHEEIEPIRWVAAPGPVGPRAYALEVAGPSMEPEFFDKDVIIVDPDIEPKPGYGVVALIDQDNEATFKRYREKRIDGHGKPVIELVPINPNWPIMTLKKGGRILAVATYHIRRLIG